MNTAIQSAFPAHQMSSRFLLLGLALVLAGCAVEPHRTVVQIVFKETMESTDQCVPLDDDDWERFARPVADFRTGSGSFGELTMTGEPIVGMVKCRFVDHGSKMSCRSGPLCNKGDRYEYAHQNLVNMTPEEFTFKYDHDKAFRDSISSYSFR